MRTLFRAVASSMMIAALLSPVVVQAKNLTVAGSLAIARNNGDALVNELVVTTVMSNPGLEKTVTQQLPLPGPIYVLPFFVSGPASLDSSVLLTNTTGAPLLLRLTLRGADGNEFQGSPHFVTLDPHATQVILLSDLLE